VEDHIVCCVPIHAESGVKKLFKNKSLKNKSRPTIEEKMTNATTENFWKAWQESTVSTPVSVFYRLYYNEQGCPVCYTMEDLPGSYIEVDKDTYLTGSYNVKVVNQKLVPLTNTYLAKLKPNSTTGTACHVRDVCVVVDQTGSHTKWNFQ
jgi:hypothetical protein